MPEVLDFFSSFDESEPTAADFANGRLTSRLYFSNPFPLLHGHTSDKGHPSRYVYRVFDDCADEPCPQDCDCEEFILRGTGKGARIQVRAHVVREAGLVRKLRMERLRRSGSEFVLDDVIVLEDQQVVELFTMVDVLRRTPPGGDLSHHVDTGLLELVMEDPDAVRRLYELSPESVRDLIEQDTSASDVVAVAARRETLREFEKLLDDDAYFDLAAQSAGGPERVWQQLLEQNPWLLGAGLSQQLFTAWDPDRLEQTVAGSQLGRPGKRVDALLETSGAARSMVFAEIKHHRTDLLVGDSYRSGVWVPSRELVGAVAQVQQTVLLAQKALGERTSKPTGEPSWLIRPRSYVIAGSTAQLTADRPTPLDDDRFRSFEAFRRNIIEPEVITFDELHARARWIVELLGDRP